MSVRHVGTEMHLPCLVVDTAPTIWHRPAGHPPPKRQALLIIYRDARSGELMREYAEFCAGRWLTVGDLCPLPCGSVVELWAYPPAIPDLEPDMELVA